MGGIRIASAILLVASVGGCKNNESSTAKSTTGGSATAGSATATTAQGSQAAGPPAPVDLAVRVGNCHPVEPTTAWISGPNPSAPRGFGFGRAGFGPGSGGTGWGTIGTGRYGTLGNSSGYAVGPGGNRGRRAASVPTLGIGTPNATGDLDKAIIRRYIKRNLPKLQYCYEKELLVKPGIGGVVDTDFTIGPKGTVTKATATGFDNTVAMCVANVIKDIQFPEPKNQGAVVVKYPFTFRPADGSPGSASAGSQKSQSAKIDDDSGGTGTAMALDEGKMGKRDADRSVGQYRMKNNADDDPALARQQAIDAARQAGILGTISRADSPMPGTRSPFAMHEDEVENCLRKQSQPYGVFLVDVSPMTQQPRTATVLGIDGPAQQCLVELASSLPDDEPRDATLRCPIAFGTMPLDDKHAVDVTADGIRYRGTMLDSKAEIEVKNDGKAQRVLDASKAYVEAAAKLTAGAPTIRGPAIVRIADTAPMSVVNAAIVTLKTAGEPYLIARQTAGKWELERDGIALPAPPVPVGQLGDWDLDAAPNPDDESVNISLHVMKDKVFVGLSRVNEFQEILVDGNLDAKLADTLAQHKASAFFVDRNDAELAGEHDVTYDVVRRVREALLAAGFTRVALTPPNGLSARAQL